MEDRPMSMIDVYAPADLFPPEADGGLGRELTHAVLRAEGVAEPGPFHLDNTAAFVHRLPNTAISTASTPSSRTVRVQIVTPPGALTRDGQRQIVGEATEIVAKFAGEEDLKNRTWVILTEAVEGGWGLSGTAFGVEEFTALARRAAEARAAQPPPGA
jgi:phenylpyruvate tautomerase PptA (4-oxalocrotonate tautomerase family)